ncbi:hypothetical protein K470DRAFT_209973 [Piedraia hortae CBS 480.64]|uniref:Uncharacterized protein n=1 Tax=Piedraia hortae CBS 480.64 TaxID=1314780 RepID=A0A6A7C8Z5_9PEZI|nr:hypothetical protein K470DRAFT_209973 [Piedraia hortae CBS 480.64]
MTPPPASSPRGSVAERRASEDVKMAHSPSPKYQTTPRRSPLKIVQDQESTPRPQTSGGVQDASAFQAGLDLRNAQVTENDITYVDDTCISTFSVIPDTTLFAKLGQSPTRPTDLRPNPGEPSIAGTPYTARKRSSLSRSPSPTARRQKTPSADGTASFLIDFTQPLDGTKRTTSPGKAATEPNLLRHLNNQRSPNKSARQSYASPTKQNNILSLLDIELPPPPTPRSVPTITVREMESLKSSYLSQISSLRATLSGREAEVESLKRAVGDAERRAGEAQEALREEKCRREHVEEEKAGWERRGHEVESVLKSVKEEVLKSEAEREDLIRKLDDTERRLDITEARAVKAEERFAEALAARAAGDAPSDANAVEERAQKLFEAQIDAKMEQVSRELHAVYKEKHERKVATLKKSYEARSEKKAAELQSRIVELEEHNKELLAGKSAPVPTRSGAESSALKAELEEHKALLSRLENEIQTSRQQQEQLMSELQQERIEKGDLVAAVDEMLALQAETGSAQGAVEVVEDFRKSISRPSGLKTPGGYQGRMPPPGTTSGGNKSRMLANIERMGRKNGGQEQ